MHPLFQYLNGLALCAALLAPLASHAAAAEGAEPARVLILGSFHFNDAGLDAVKSSHKDVMQPAEQQYLQALAQRLASFKPTHVLLEFPEAAHGRVNAEYRAYSEGRQPLGRNEIDQIGYRVAKLAGLAQVHGIDVAAPELPNPVWERQPDIAPTMQLVQKLTERTNEEHRRLSLQQLLEKLNSPESDRENKSIYMSFNAVGAADRSFSGADSAANWWQRNFRIYAQVQRHAQPGARVLLLVGAGHAAILRDLLRIDEARREEPTLPYLR
ncbi:DUF5694 domain-containing protein [Paucibacter sp. APW11]|uniref:DUF5694 domain-containing protein n=1 Tax=Roseateles aquae TaxID=3077235 RepID=A0ABU3PIN5_9BURK|nr:DUF5694 domain-containing protein [Paucibacter sp. APW11]MDT9002425.1 DUF5694 domain-containing protein [Paucibacter sp. APW11]